LNNWIFKAHEGLIFTVEKLNAKLYASGAFDKKIKIWKNKQCFQTFNGHHDCVTSLLFDFEKMLISGSDDGTIRSWDIVNAKELRKFKCDAVVINGLKYLYHDLILSSHYNNKEIQLIDFRNKNSLRKFKGHSNVIWAIQVINELQFVSGCEDGLLNFYDIRMSLPFKSYNVDHSVNCIECDSDSNLIIGLDTSMAFFKLEQSIDFIHENCNSFLGHNDKVIFIKTFSNMIISCSNDKTIKIWNKYSKSCVHTIVNNEVCFCVA
jgi:WD40 repeat protein